MLRAILIDDERPALDELSYLLKKNAVEVIGTFLKTEGTLDYILAQNPDIVFLDIEMRGTNGIEFGVELQKKSENTAIIFVTAYPEYALEAFRAYPLDYIVKPIDEEHLERTLKHILETSQTQNPLECKSFYIQCFGKFEITYGNQKVRLPTKKTQELLAYLLCNEGNTVYRNDLMQVIFDNGDVEKDANNLRVNLFRIRNAFREAGVENKTFIVRDDFSVKIGDGICDLVDFQRFIKKNQVVTSNNVKQAEKIVDILNPELLTNIDALWVTEKRECIMSQAEELIVTLSSYYLTNGLPERAETVLLKLLNLNPVSESGYHCLLDLYIQTENALKFRRYYERYEKILAEFEEHPLKFYAYCYENFYKPPM
ncbi:MAG: response regulator [Anaerotignum sp.]|nr:response regulator [Anaerotignum sp.]